MKVYDPDLILSWEPKEYESFIKGAMHARIDEQEMIAKQAMAFRYSMHAKRARETAIFNAKKARWLLEKGFKQDVQVVEKERVRRMTNALKGVKLVFIPLKGGR